jgi:hypothetical protein
MSGDAEVSPGGVVVPAGPLLPPVPAPAKKCAVHTPEVQRHSPCPQSVDPASQPAAQRTVLQSGACDRLTQEVKVQHVAGTHSVFVAHVSFEGLGASTVGEFDGAGDVQRTAQRLRVHSHSP